MSYKTILVHLDESDHTKERILISANLARNCDAHLIGVATTGLSGQFYFPGPMGESNLAISNILEDLRRRANAVLTKFEMLAKEMHVKSFERRLIEEDAGEGLSLQARCSDLVVIGQFNPEKFSPGIRSDFPQYVLMHSGRPVFIVPYAGRFEKVGKRILIAWDGSIEASRAVTSAIPLLKNAEVVQVVVFNRDDSSAVYEEHSGANIAPFLARHDVTAEVSRQSMPSDLDVGNALLSYASDFNADLIVMGGYGHTRLREVLLGGVTRTILATMTVPVLMSH
jgi:nucleotide-binding universal stress UspA family protein